jgi:pimeloyl-ACP methyl ester carboxylesterase
MAAPWLRRQTLSLALSSTTDIRRNVLVTEWGCEPQDAKASIFYFGGMPSSASFEVPLHSMNMNTTTTTTDTPQCSDIYLQKGIHLIYIDKPGIGGTDLDPNFSIRKDWPRIVSQVADHLLVKSSSSSLPPTYGIMGYSNGGPYVMACLTASDETIRRRVSAAACIVGVSDVWASGYFGWNHLSGVFEGIFNSMPISVAGPCTWLGMQLGKWYLQLNPKTTAVAKLLGYPVDQATNINKAVVQVISDSSKHLGRGTQLDCQQTLSPLYARPSKDNEACLSADSAYRRIEAPVSLWYGRQDTTIPLATAEWLAARVPNCTKHIVDGTHILYFQHTEAILDDLVNKIITATKEER